MFPKSLNWIEYIDRAFAVGIPYDVVSWNYFHLMGKHWPTELNHYALRLWYPKAFPYL